MSRAVAAAFAPLHRWGGLVFGWVLFGVFLTGALTVFSPEISYWATPSLRVEDRVSRKEALERGLSWLEAHAAHARVWRVTMPTERSPTIGVISRGGDGSTVKELHPMTLDAVSPNGEGGHLFFSYHYSLNVARSDNPFFFWLVAVAAVFFIVAAISGIVIRGRILRGLFRVRMNSGASRAWMDIHTLFGVTTFLFHVLILCTGLWLIYWTYMPAGVQAAYGGDTSAHRAEIVRDGVQSARPSPGEPVQTLSIPDLFARAEQIMGEGKASHLVVRDVGRSTMLMEVWRRRDDRPGQQVERVLLDGRTGEVLRHLDRRSTVLSAHSVAVGLHMAEFGGLLLRLFYHACSLAGAVVVIAGLARFIRKRRRPGRKPPLWLRAVEILSIASTSGLVCAVAIYMLALRFPISGELSVLVYCSTLGAALLHAIARPAVNAVVEQWLVAGTACFLAAIAPPFNAPANLWAAVANHDWTRVGVDLALLLWGVGMWTAAALTMRQELRPES